MFFITYIGLIFGSLCVVVMGDAYAATKTPFPV